MPTPTIPLSKPGKHGTLHLYRIEYRDGSLSPVTSGHWYGYSADDGPGSAAERLADYLDSDYLEILSVTRVRA